MFLPSIILSHLLPFVLVNNPEVDPSTPKPHGGYSGCQLRLEDGVHSQPALVQIPVSHHFPAWRTYLHQTQIEQGCRSGGYLRKHEIPADWINHIHVLPIKNWKAACDEREVPSCCNLQNSGQSRSSSVTFSSCRRLLGAPIYSCTFLKIAPFGWTPCSIVQWKHVWCREHHTCLTSPSTCVLLTFCGISL